jgi:hypothetical protein
MRAIRAVGGHRHLGTESGCLCRLATVISRPPRTIETADLGLRHEPSEVVRHGQVLPKALGWQSAARSWMRDPSAYTLTRASG